MKQTKGCYGYLNNKKRTETGKTILYFALSGAIFAMGYFTAGTKTNLWTIVAVLICLPASKSAVSMIMYLKAGICSQKCHQALAEYEDNTLLLYDLYLTSYQKNFQISALAVKNNALCGYTEDPRCDVAAGEKHISELLAQNGYTGVTVKLFSDWKKFLDRMQQLEELAKKQEEKEAALAEVIREISL